MTKSFRVALPAFLCLLAVALSPARAAEPVEHGFLDRTFKDGETEAKYVLFVPHDYTGDKPYPLVVFLHGSGSTGTDGKKQVGGIAAAIKKDEKAFPAFVIFPQSQKRTWRADSEDGKRAMAILAEVEKQYKVDPKRVYLTGLS